MKKIKRFTKNKNYSPIFWKLLGYSIGLGVIYMSLENISEKLPITSNLFEFILFILFIILVFFWCKYFNEAWAKINKKHGWAIGLITIIPLGSIIAFLIARHYLKNTNYWKKSDKNKVKQLDLNKDKLSDKKKKKLKFIGLMIILLMIILFFTTIILVYKHTSEEINDMLVGPIILIFTGAIIGFTFYFNNKIEAKS